MQGSCKTHGEVEIRRLAADQLFGVEDENIGNDAVMSNIYVADRKWDGVEKVRKLMKSKNVKKPAGRRRHVFVAGDLAHPRRSSIYETMASLNQQTKVPPSQVETV